MLNEKNGLVYAPYITRNGVRIYPKNAKVFVFPARPRKKRK